MVDIGPVGRAAAFSVHILTASGAALGLLALIAAVEGRWTQMFLWLGIALVVDGIDGLLARRLNVRLALPRWSGDVLDLVVDIVTYVFVPAYAIVQSRLLPETAAVPLGLLIVVTGTLYFADRRMKSADNYFFGFPAVWNLVAFYLYLLKPDPWIGALAVVGLSVMTFLPVPFVHPLRVNRLRKVNLVLLVLWAVLAIVALAHDLSPAPLVTAALSVTGLYFLGAGLLRSST